MVESLGEGAEACFGDDVFLLDLVDANERRAERGGGGGGGAMFLDIFDHAYEGLAVRDPLSKPERKSPISDGAGA